MGKAKVDPQKYRPVVNNGHPSLNADSVAEYVIEVSLSLLKKIPLLHQETVRGSWPRNSFTLNEIKGKTFGFIGFGEIAKKVFKRLEPFKVHCVAHDPYMI